METSKKERNALNFAQVVSNIRSKIPVNKIKKAMAAIY
jgi:hypothetical protein